MSKQASPNLISEAPFELIAHEPWSIETYADGLMDELFSDLDGILDGKSHLSNQIVQSQPAPMERVTMPDVRTGSIVRSMQPVPQPKTKARTVVNQPSVTKRVKKRSTWRRGLVKWLRLGTTFSVAIASVVWLFNSGLLNRMATQSYQLAIKPPQPQPQLQPQIPDKVKVRNDLVNYMLASLAAIERQEAKAESVSVNMSPSTNRNTLASANTNQTPPLNPPVAANNAPPVPSRSTRVVERVYIPIYQAPQPMRYAPPSVASLPQLPPVVASKSTPIKTAVNQVKQAGKKVTATAMAAIRHDMKPIQIKSAPVTVQQAPKPPKLADPKPATPPQIPAAAKAPPAPEKEVASAPTTPDHILEGLLELGEKSAALFQVNGITRRIEIGENIGRSGWTLVDVTNGEAVIRRNGEVRSIVTGQKF